MFFAFSLTVVANVYFDILYLGWESGFHYYILLLFPVYLIYSKWTLKENIIVPIVILGLYGLIYWYSLNFSPYHPMNKDLLQDMNMVNLVCSFLGAFVMMMYSNISIGMMEKKLHLKNDKLNKRNEEKEVLLKEIHHRVKNNLHVVNSILEVQSMELQDRKLKSYLQDAQRRIISMATIHEKMYGSESLKYICLKDYFSSLVDDLSVIYDAERKVNLKLDIEKIRLHMDVIAPLAFLINEIITNSYKHAFNNNLNPTIFLSVEAKENRIFITVGDNGLGFDDENTGTGIQRLGVDLIESFSQELKANMYRENNNGVIYRIDFAKTMK